MCHPCNIHKRVQSKRKILARDNLQILRSQNFVSLTQKAIGIKCLVFLNEGTLELCIQWDKFTATVYEDAGIRPNWTKFSDKAFLEIFGILTTQHTILIQCHKPIVINVTDLM